MHKLVHIACTMPLFSGGFHVRLVHDVNSVSSLNPSSPSGLSNPDVVDYVGILEDGAVEVATRSRSSAAPIFAHTSVADAYKDEQYCMDHNSRIPEPNTGETHLWVTTFIPLHQHL